MNSSENSFEPWSNNSKINARFYFKSVSLEDLKTFFSSNTKVASLKQIHSNTIIEINDRDFGKLAEGDAIVTKLEDVALTVHTADCLPLLATDGNVIGACHAGWRGLSSGIIETWIARMKLLGTNLARLQVAIGPSIGPCHFEVGKDVSAQLLKGTPPKFRSQFQKSHSNPDKDYISLRDLARYKLLSAGVSVENLITSEECTYCDSAKYHSYRRDGAKGLRLEAVIVKPSR